MHEREGEATIQRYRKVKRSQVSTYFASNIMNFTRFSSATVFDISLCITRLVISLYVNQMLSVNGGSTSSYMRDIGLNPYKEDCFDWFVPSRPQDYRGLLQEYPIARSRRIPEEMTAHKAETNRHHNKE